MMNFLLLTNSNKYGTNIKAIPAVTLLAPTPIFLNVVGYNSAVKTGMIALEELILILLIMENVVTTHWRLFRNILKGTMNVQAMPENIMVKAKGHLLPPFIRIGMLTARAGTSTKPVNT